ncbi:MAG: hypothetical protein KIH08_14020 [Candidatus Freyarchaeota archaeon]|nr:hypothetical protein [Candidatus Jordarchaeia archaeon]MBS7267920.1 hypothetical protein [Candidatus Jordarchaeia archaeon]MBS7280674.1 hypothetical protein [Candidatus Jordarchaeia archaeon]
MPEVYCNIPNRMVDGGYCSLICNLPETEERIFYNPFRGIIAECNFGALPEPETKTLPRWQKRSNQKNQKSP